MRVLCIFRGSKLVETSTAFHPSFVPQFKENVAFQLGCDVSELDCISYEHEAIKAYLKPTKGRPTKKVVFTKDSATLIDIIRVPSTGMRELNWQNCTQAQIEEHFSVEEQAKINTNKEYYDSLGVEKHQAGFVFEWPETITNPVIEMPTDTPEEQVFLEVNGTLVE